MQYLQWEKKKFLHYSPFFLIQVYTENMIYLTWLMIRLTFMCQQLWLYFIWGYHPRLDLNTSLHQVSHSYCTSGYVQNSSIHAGYKYTCFVTSQPLSWSSQLCYQLLDHQKCTCVVWRQYVCECQALFHYKNRCHCIPSRHYMISSFYSQFSQEG